MALRFFNTLEGREMLFTTIQPGIIRIYTCGPTVYDYAHIGNFRAYVFQDLLRRWLEYRGYKVTQVMNITDVDDKTIRGARSEGVPLKTFTEKYTQAFFQDLETLNVKKAEVYPRATEHIGDMVALVRELLKRDYAYKGEDGSVYYRISAFNDYGKLSKLKIQELKTGARVKADEYAKEHPQDFALWKAWDPEDGETGWETELGKGRPGWHIECSAMSMHYLGETFDIHSGGVDLVFPHHENEIAQSEGATGKKFVNFWLHCEHLIVEGKKMSKSLGNFYTLRDLLQRGHDPMGIRFILLSTHYRQQLNFTFQGLDAAANTVQRLKDFLHRLRQVTATESYPEVATLVEDTKQRFEAVMDNDLDVNTALAHLFEFVKEINKRIDDGKINRHDAQVAFEFVKSLDSVLGLLGSIEWAEEELPPDLMELIRRREEARRLKDWTTADEIRGELLQRGVIVEDTPKGVTWKRVK
ncbi:MAG: cysteine--tRNA ligase [Candidatus Bathyarchaeia archaeon]